MPKLKLRDWQFRLMLSAVQDNADYKLAEIHSILTNYHGANFPLSLSEVQKQAIPFLEYHKKQKELYETKIHLFKLEHAGDISEEDSMLLQEYREKHDSSATLIHKVEDGLDTVEKLNKIANIIAYKTSEKDFIKSYDDEPKPAYVDDDPDPMRPPLTG